MTIKQKIIKISNELRLTKSGENKYANYNYFKPDEILSALNPLLEKYNLFMSFNLPYNHDKVMYEAVLYFEDLEDDKQNLTYKFDIPLTKVSGSSEAQGAGATMTYAKRYSIMNAFSIADNNDDLDSKPPVQEKPATKQNSVPDTMLGVKICPVPDCGKYMIRQENKKNPKSPDWKCSDKNCKFKKAYGGGWVRSDYITGDWDADQKELARANHEDSILEEANQIPPEYGNL